MVIPLRMRPEILQQLHSSHQRVQSTLRRTRDIELVVSRCSVCEETSSALPREKLMVHEILGKPWEKVGMDLFRVQGRDLLIIVDYLTDYFEISELMDTSASAVVQAVKQQFARHGIPVWVHSDSGSQFAAREFTIFSQAWGFEHTVSSPYSSQSNIKAESAVKIAKWLFKRSKDPYLALLENTPTIGMGSSPCQRLLARRTRGIFPMEGTCS